MQALAGFNFSKAYDQRIYINKPREYSILQAASQVLPQVQSAVSGQNTNTITFNVNPSENSIIDRNMNVKYYLKYTFTGTTSSGGINLIDPSTDCLKPLPISTCMANCTVQLNGQSFTNTPKDYVQAMLRFCDPDKRAYNFSLTPSQPDFAQDYSIWNPGTAVIGLSRSPFSAFGNNTTEDSRAAFTYTVASNTPTSAEVFVQVTEPLFISPLIWENKQSPGLVLLNQLSIQIQLSNLKSSWSHLTVSGTSTRTLSNVDVSFSAPPELLYSELNPKSNIEISRTYPYSYPYNHLYVQTNNPETIISGGTNTVTTSTISIPVIPEKMYLYLKRTDDTRSFDTTETFSVIESVSIKFGTQAGILSACSQQDLWKISVKNGLRMSWQEWSRYSGSVLCLSFGDDIDLGDAAIAPGLLTKLPLQVTARCKNTGLSTVQYTPYVVLQYPGVVQCLNGLYSQNDGIFTEESLRSLQGQSLPISPFVSDPTLVFGGFSVQDLYKGVRSGSESVKDSSAPSEGGMLKMPSAMRKPKSKMSKLSRRMAGMGLSGGALLGGALLGGCDNCPDNVISRAEMLKRLDD